MITSPDTLLKRHIWDTNAFNHVLDSAGIDRIPRIARALGVAGLRPALTPVNLVEIAATPDLERRASLMLAAVEICLPVYLQSPETIIRAHVAAISEDASLRKFVDISLVDKGEIGSFVQDRLIARDVTALLGSVHTERVSHAKFAEKAINSLVSRGTFQELGLTEEAPQGGSEPEIREYWRRLSSDVRARPPDRALDRITTRAHDSLVTWIVCSCETPFGADMNELWVTLGVDDLASRVEYVRTRWASLNGSVIIKQLVGMYCMQALTHHDTGNLLDLLQTAYLHHGVSWLTNDPGVLKYAATVPAMTKGNLVQRFSDVIEPILTALC